MNAETFGRPREGIHATRFLGLAFWDLVGTGVGAYALSRYTALSFASSFGLLWLAGSGLHWYFGVQAAGLDIFSLGPQ